MNTRKFLSSLKRGAHILYMCPTTPSIRLGYSSRSVLLFGINATSVSDGSFLKANNLKKGIIENCNTILGSLSKFMAGVAAQSTAEKFYRKKEDKRLVRRSIGLATAACLKHPYDHRLQFLTKTNR